MLRINNKKSKNTSVIAGKPKPKTGKKKGNVSVMNIRKQLQPILKIKKQRGPMTRQVLNNSLTALSPCAAKYACAIANPWSPDATSACIPYGNSRESQKTTTFLRVDAQVGTLGVGFVVISPTTANDAPYCWYTGPTFAGTNASIVATGTGTTSTVGVAPAYMINLPFTRTQLNTGSSSGQTVSTRGRIVSVGASASYTGTELNMGGLMYCYTDPVHASTNGADVAYLGSRFETDVANTSRDKCWLMASAVDLTELDYPSVTSDIRGQMASIFPYSGNAYLDQASASGQHLNGAAPMIILFTGVPGNTVHFEFIQHSEFIGALTEGRTTPSSLDPEGAQKVMSAANRVPQMKQSKPGVKYGKLFYEALEYAGRELLPVGVAALKGMLL